MSLQKLPKLIHWKAYNFHHKTRSWRSYKKSSNFKDLDVFLYLLSKFEHLTALMYKSYVITIECNISSNPRTYWSISNSKRPTFATINTMTDNRPSLDTSNEISSVCANYSSKLFSIEIPNLSNSVAPKSSMDKLNIKCACAWTVSNFFQLQTALLNLLSLLRFHI